ncbi:hypothetical protein [Lacisediminihabitans sp.]|uniref:hypothetical protein n=1 Tax=Lacisediminihabitans sp. TaxID=2787631 RepID=UPI00374D1DE3
MTATLAVRAEAEPAQAELIDPQAEASEVVDGAALNDAALSAAVESALRGPRARGLERVAITLGVAMLRWARTRARRNLMFREEHARSFATVCDVELRQHRSLSRAMRVS